MGVEIWGESSEYCTFSWENPVTLEQAKERAKRSRKRIKAVQRRRKHEAFLRKPFCLIWLFRHRDWTTSKRHKMKAMERDFQRYLIDRRRKKS